MSTNLGHRLTDVQSSSTKILYQIQKPLSFFIPILLVILGAISFRSLWGVTGETGTLSVVLVPFIGPFLAPFLPGEKNLFLSTLVVASCLLAAVTQYIYVKFLTHRHLPAIIAGLLLLLPLIPISSEPHERILLGLIGNDAAHVIGTSLIPLSILFFQKYLRSGKRTERLIFTLIAATIGLISFFALSMLVIFLFFISISETLVESGKLKLIRFGKSAVVLLASFTLIYNISLLPTLTSDIGSATVNVFGNLFPMLFFLVPVLGTISFLIFDRRPDLQPLFIGLSGSVVFGILHFIGVTFTTLPEFGQERFAAEFAYGLSMLMGVLVTGGFDLLRSGVATLKIPQLHTKRSQLALLAVGVFLASLLASLLFIERTL